MLRTHQIVGIVIILVSFAVVPILLHHFLPSYRVEGFHAPQCVHPPSAVKDAIDSNDVRRYNVLADRVHQLYSSLAPMKTQLCDVVEFAKESDVKDRTATLMEESGTAPTETGDAPEHIKQKARTDVKENHRPFKFCESSTKTAITFSVEPIYVSTEMSYSTGIEHGNALLHTMSSMQSVLGYSQWEPALNLIEPDLKRTSMSAANTSPSTDGPETFTMPQPETTRKNEFDSIITQIETKIDSFESAHGLLARIEANTTMKQQIEELGANAKKNEEKQSNAIATA